MLVPGPQICCPYEMPGPWTSIVSGNYVRDTSVKRRNKIVQEITRNVRGKCFQFLCINSDWTWFFNGLTFARSLRRCWKPRPSASVFNTSHGTLRMLMHRKPCLITIIKYACCWWSLYVDRAALKENSYTCFGGNYQKRFAYLLKLLRDLF